MDDIGALPGKEELGMELFSSPKSEENAVLEVEDFGLKVCVLYSSILSSRSLTKVIKSLGRDLVA